MKRFFRKIKKVFEKLFWKKVRIKELEKKLEETQRQREVYRHELNASKQYLFDEKQKAVDELNDIKQKYEKTIRSKDDEIDELRRKIDILYSYYDLDKEASQETKTKMRIDMRIHELEMENLDLKNQVRTHNDWVLNTLRTAQQMNYIYSQQQQAFALPLCNRY